ncbi:helix-turn-helix transcriptional regulator [Gordonia amicalis]|uniref:helix-turn-helix domain-containing protein n=1 Tax=Gordonia amicalis TaxID=89053 RepID=UPI0022B5B016|nr:helix-turn-helix transcriptional regulator [Gordonia amicalis]MCZ4579422.1 helix-turn-helix transcriptional regulator [Gordonia amicalis]
MPKPKPDSLTPHQRWERDVRRAALAAALIAARERQGLTRAQLAERARIDRTMLYRVETGKTSLSVDLLWDVCRALHLAPSELLAAAEADDAAAQTLSDD